MSSAREKGQVRRAVFGNRMGRVAGLGFAIVLLAAPSAAGAADRFAEVGGDGAEPCASSDPCSIERAVNDASSGDDVTLLGGIPPASPYATAAQLNVPAGVTVHGAPGARPLIQTTNQIGVQVAAGATLRDVTIRNLNINGTGLINAGGTTERIHSRTDGDWGCELLAGAVIRDSVCFTTTTDTFDGAGLLAFHGSPTSVSVTVRNVTAVASQPGVPGLKALPLNTDAVLSVLATNVIAKGGSTDVTTSTTAGQAHITLDHSNYETAAEGSVAHSISDPGTGTNQIGNVAFKDAAAGDFRQTGTSIGTIDLGVAGVLNGVDLGTADVDGESRTAGPLPDIGADEGGIPDAPFVTSVDPANTADALTPKVQGTAAGSTEVYIFTNDTCMGMPVATGTTAQFEGAGIGVTVLPGSQTVFWAQALRNVFGSDCSSIRSPGPGANQIYSVVPTPPVLQMTDPTGPADNNTPRIIGTGRSDASSVQIYDDAACTSQVGSGSLVEFSTTGIPVSVMDNTTTVFYGKATGTHGTSGCSTSSISYMEVTPPPAAPTLSSTVPASGSDDNNPRVVGTAPGADSVSIYKDAYCSAPAAATGTRVAFEAGGIPVSVPDNSTTTFYAKASSLAGISGCSKSFVTYTEVTPAPPAPSAVGTPSARKCKKGQKLKKGKCVKKKRKKK